MVFINMGKYNCDRSVFSEIKTEREAYWLGFIMADGHNHQNKTLRVDIKDEGHLNDLSKLIYPDGNKPIKTRDLGFGDIYYFHCGVGDVVRNLSNHGVIPNKSKKTVLPIIPNEMYNHFIRGLFDGDGSLSFSYDGNYRRYTFSIVGNDELMIGLKKVIKNQINIDLGFGKMKMIHRVYKRGNRQIMTILDWLYKDSTISLSRKNEKYQEMLKYYKNK
jgi:hypothetical protein